MRDFLINFAIFYTLGAVFFDILGLAVMIVRGRR